MRGVFVTGTDTGVGKSVLSAVITATLVARGLTVRACKPAITGLADPPDPVWPPDHLLLASLTGQRPEEVAPIGFEPAVSPHLAAELAGAELTPQALRGAVAGVAAAGGDVLVVEGVGGLLVPLAPDYDVRALIAELRLPVVVAARPGLGTINHTLLTLEAARVRSLDVRGVVITPWPYDPDVMTRSNRDTIARLGEVAVSQLAPLTGPDPAALAAAGAALPIDDWLG